MDVYNSERKRTPSKARARYEARRAKNSRMATPIAPNTPAEDPAAVVPARPRTEPPPSVTPTLNLKARRDGRAIRRAAATSVRGALRIEPVQSAFSKSRAVSRASMLARDIWWHLRTNRMVHYAAVGLVAFFIFGFVGAHLLTGRIYPNVYALGTALGSQTLDEASAALRQRWETVTIRLVDQDRSWTAVPAELGISLDAEATASTARSAGLAGLPFGYQVTPAVALDFVTAQNYFLNLTESSRVLPYNAGYRWENGDLVGVPGTDGRFLDIAQTMQALESSVAQIVETGQLTLAMTPVPPEVTDPAPYLEEARAFAAQPFQMRGYDPFTNEFMIWTADRDTLTSWLEAGADGLTLREETFAEFVRARTEELAAADPLRFIEPTESYDKMHDAIAAGDPAVQLRVRYRGDRYEIQSGDTGYGIARRTGVPFYLIQQANPGRDWEVMLNPGEMINLPSRDFTLPIDPVPNKRIVVNIDTQSLVAYENGEIVFQWAISTGMDYAPTSPGIYQILSHNETASGSSYELCSNDTCGSWTMYWFMGIYEVVPGLVNGFHGAVLLPNGTYLGGGNVGSPFTYGCVMSENSNAEALYHWADEGTVVEIISSDFGPMSDLGREALQITSAPRPSTNA